MEYRSAPNPLFDFADETAWTNEQLAERSADLQRHTARVLLGETRRTAITRELVHIGFEVGERFGVDIDYNVLNQQVATQPVEPPMVA